MKTKAQTIMENIGKLKEELREVQNKCKHKKVVKTYRSNRDDYDRLDISYYTDFYCPTCQKYWQMEGSL